MAAPPSYHRASTGELARARLFGVVRWFVVLAVLAAVVGGVVAKRSWLAARWETAQAARGQRAAASATQQAGDDRNCPLAGGKDKDALHHLMKLLPTFLRGADGQGENCKAVADAICRNERFRMAFGNNKNDLVPSDGGHSKATVRSVDWQFLQQVRLSEVVTAEPERRVVQGSHKLLFYDRGHTILAVNGQGVICVYAHLW